MAAPASYWLRHFRLLLWNHWMEFNETWKEARSQRPLPSLWFSGRSERQDGHPVSDWLLLCDRYLEFNETWKEARSKRHLPRLCFSGRLEKQDGHPGFWLAETFSASPLKPMNGIQQNSQEARSQRLLSRLCFSGLSEEQDSRPGLWLAEAFSISPLKPLNGIQQNLTGRKISTPSNKFVFFGSIGGKRWPPSLWDISTSPPWPLNKIQRNLTGSKISASSTNLCYSIDETWQEARYQCPIQSLFFFGRWEKQDGCPGLWLTETFSTSPPNGIQQNLTGNKICQRHLPSLCFSGRSEKHFTHVYDMWPLGLLFVY